MLLDRLPDLRLDVAVEDSPFLRGNTTLPVRFTPVRMTGEFS